MKMVTSGRASLRLAIGLVLVLTGSALGDDLIERVYELKSLVRIASLPQPPALGLVSNAPSAEEAPFIEIQERDAAVRCILDAARLLIEAPSTASIDPESDTLKIRATKLELDSIEELIREVREPKTDKVTIETRWLEFEIAAATDPAAAKLLAKASMRPGMPLLLTDAEGDLFTGDVSGASSTAAPRITLHSGQTSFVSATSDQEFIVGYEVDSGRKPDAWEPIVQKCHTGLVQAYRVDIDPAGNRITLEGDLQSARLLGVSAEPFKSNTPTSLKVQTPLLRFGRVKFHASVLPDRVLLIRVPETQSDGVGEPQKTLTFVMIQGKPG